MIHLCGVIPSVDLHCDTLSEFRRAHMRGEEIFFSENYLHIDLRKLRKGGRLLQCFACYVNLSRESDPFTAAMEQAYELQKIVSDYPDDVIQIFSKSDMDSLFGSGKIGALLTGEEGAICRGEVQYLKKLYDTGMRIMTFTWNYKNMLASPNRIQDGVCVPETEAGLTELGLMILNEMESLGILPDVSHLSDKGIWEVLQNARKPFVVSHSNARSLCGHPRNLTDEMLHALGDKGCIIGLNFCNEFLDPDFNSGSAKSTAAFMADHIIYMIQHAGVSSVALGSDFDGIDGYMEIGDVSKMKLLELELHHRGLSDSQIESVFFRNAWNLIYSVLPD